MWKMSKPATVWVFLCLVAEIPINFVEVHCQRDMLYPSCNI